MAYNYQKLLGRIVEFYGTQYEFAKAMGLSEHSLSVKLNNKANFKQVEIAKACELLNILPSKISDYFFTLKVQNNLTFGKSYNERTDENERVENL